MCKDKKKWGEIAIDLTLISKEKEVQIFLDKLKSFITRKDFNIDKDFFLNLNGDIKRERKYSTRYAMDVLEYDKHDIVEILSILSAENYSETKIDIDDTNPPLLFVFGKIIDNKETYIKIKLKETNRSYIACISFHFSKYKMEYPYRKNRREKKWKI